MKSLSVLILTLFCFVISCSKDDGRNVVFGSFADNRDGKTYKTITIGNQIWMAENLNYHTISGSWCYDNDTNNAKKYGRLYLWETAINAAPEGWRLPGKGEFDTLISFFGSGSAAYSHLIDGGSSGFDALLGGFSQAGYSFSDKGKFGYFWTSTGNSSNADYCIFRKNEKKVLLYNFSTAYAYSIRCIKD